MKLNESNTSLIEINNVELNTSLVEVNNVELNEPTTSLIEVDDVDDVELNTSLIEVNNVELNEYVAEEKQIDKTIFEWISMLRIAKTYNSNISLCFSIVILFFAFFIFVFLHPTQRFIY